jgi:hypothetical protein
MIIAITATDSCTANLEVSSRTPFCWYNGLLPAFGVGGRVMIEYPADSDPLMASPPVRAGDSVVCTHGGQMPIPTTAIIPTSKTSLCNPFITFPFPPLIQKKPPRY